MEQEHYDLVIGDEAWDVDYYYHENPELKRQPFVFLTDFVGCLPMDGDDEREALLCADRNADDIEHVARFPYVRDAAIFVGNPEDVTENAVRPRAAAASANGPTATSPIAGYALPFDPRHSRTPGRLRARTATGRREDRHRLGRRHRASAGRCCRRSPRRSRS